MKMTYQMEKVQIFPNTGQMEGFIYMYTFFFSFFFFKLTFVHNQSK